MWLRKKEKQMATANTYVTYAASRNARYYSTQSNLVDLVTRYKDAIASMTHQAQLNWKSKLSKALKEFRKNHPGLKSIGDRIKFRLCQAHQGKMCRILIDTTIQREPNLQWILNIITNFRAYQAQPIQVYVTGCGGLGSWDGQHTALALYLIAVEGLGETFEDVEVPVNVYDIASRGEIRQNFICNNSTTGKSAGKKPLDIIDKFQQMIYGVEVDGSQDTDWKAAHAKWKSISSAGMFITAEKFNDTERIGAISRLEEIEKASVKVVQQFAVYGKYIVGMQQRHLNAKELPIIIEFLNLCEKQDIEYTDKQIRDLAQHCIDLFDANFDAKGPYWDQCHRANINAYNKANKKDEDEDEDHESLLPAPRNNKTTPVGVAFLWHQLSNSWAPTQPKGFKFPKQPDSMMYIPDTRDLF